VGVGVDVAPGPPGDRVGQVGHFGAVQWFREGVGVDQPGQLEHRGIEAGRGD